MKAATARLIDAGSEFLNGVTLSGQASKVLDQMMKSASLEWSIQDDVIQVLDIGGVLEDISVVLTDTTGLIGSPTIGTDGIIRLKTLLNSDIVPGRELEVTSKVLSGNTIGGIGEVAGVNLGLDLALGLGGDSHRFRVERVEYTGSNFDADFFCDIEASEL